MLSLQVTFFVLTPFPVTNVLFWSTFTSLKKCTGCFMCTLHWSINYLKKQKEWFMFPKSCKRLSWINPFSFSQSFLYGFYLLFTKWPGFIFHFKHLPPIPPLAQAVVSTGLPLHSRRLPHERNPRRDLKKQNKTKTWPSHFSHWSNSLQGKKPDRVYQVFF